MSFKIFTKTQSFGNIDLEGVIGLEMSIHRIRNGSSSGILMFFFFCLCEEDNSKGLAWSG